MKAFREVVSLLLPLFLASCAGSGSMVFSNVEKAGAFPEQHDLKLDESELVAIDVPGIRSMISLSYRH